MNKQFKRLIDEKNKALESVIKAQICAALGDIESANELPQLAEKYLKANKKALEYELLYGSSDIKPVGISNTAF